MNSIPRGYTITPKVKFLRTKDGKKRTNLVGKSAILSAGKDLIAAKELAGEFDESLNENL